MATATPSPATCQSEFEQSVAYALHLWPALTLSVQNNWGGADSADKRDWFAGAIVELFPDISKFSPQQLLQNQQAAAAAQTQQSTPQQQSKQTPASTAVEEPEQADVEAVLLQVMLDEFEVAVDDDSALLVSEQIMRARTECLRGKFDGEVAQLRRRWSSKKPNEKIEFKLVEDKSGEDTDWDTDDDEEEEGDSDEEMGDAQAPELVNTKKKEPEVDEDGFTTVVSRKKK